MVPATIRVVRADARRSRTPWWPVVTADYAYSESALGRRTRAVAHAPRFRCATSSLNNSMRLRRRDAHVVAFQLIRALHSNDCSTTLQTTARTRGAATSVRRPRGGRLSGVTDPAAPPFTRKGAGRSDSATRV